VVSKGFRSKVLLRNTDITGLTLGNGMIGLLKNGRVSKNA
jgi:hypothetical protein